MASASMRFQQNGYLFASDAPCFALGSGDFSVEAWIQTTSGGAIIAKKGSQGGQGNGGFLFVAQPDGVLRLATDDGIGYFEAYSNASAVCDGVWHHVAAVRQGEAIRLYLDGAQLEHHVRGTAAPPLDVTNHQRLTIATVDQDSETYRWFTGEIAEVRLWSHALGDDAIAAARNLRLRPGAPNLVGYWPLEFGLTLDFSDNLTATTLVGMVTYTTDAPAIIAYGAPQMLFLFAGGYDTATRPTGSSSVWQPQPSLVLTRTGYAVYDGAVLKGASILGNTLTWPAQAGGVGAGSVTFKLSSSDTRFWPSGAQDTYNFEGSMTAAGGSQLDFRGQLAPVRKGCSLILNIGTGLVLHTPSPAPGSWAMLATKTTAVSDHYCLHDAQIIQMSSGLALSASNFAAGAPVVLATPSNICGQAWALGADGLIRPSSDSNLALSVLQDGPLTGLVMAAADPADPNQQFITLGHDQFIWSGEAPNVLSASGAGFTQATVSAKSSNAIEEHWYVCRGSLINAANALALTVDGTAAPGAALSLNPWSPANASQAFAFQGGQLIHVGSGLPVKMTGAGEALILGDAGEIGAALFWAVAPHAPVNTDSGMVRAPRTLTLAQTTPQTVDYVVRITTANSLAAGTDDSVKIELVGDTISPLIALTNSSTHSNPFEAGQMDKFTVRTPSVGPIIAVNISYGDNVWFYRDRWVLSQVSVYDPTDATTYVSNSVGNGSDYSVPAWCTIDLPNVRLSGSDSLLSIGKAPTQDDKTQGWVDHTWGKAVSSGNSVEDGLTTYFDCAGGHDGPGAVNGIITADCQLDLLVRMATGSDLSETNPYKSAYGTGDVNGIETCGVRASGFRNWDGQCHQMANRLLYACEHPTTLDETPENLIPRGYGLSVLMFGRYGAGFADWCRRVGFPVPNEDTLIDFVRRTITNTNDAIKVMYHAVTLQGATADDPQWPEGPAVQAFFTSVYEDGVPDAEVVELVCLTEDEVKAERDEL